MRTSAPRVSVLTLALLGCSDSQQPCEFCTTSAVVYGQVRYAGGGPIAHAPVAVDAHREICSSSDILAGSPSGFATGENGSYRVLLTADGNGFIACPRVSAVAPGTGLTAAVDGPTVVFHPDGATQQLDSVRVDVEVPIAAAPYQPTPDRLVGEFQGSGGEDFQVYNLFLAIDEVADSVRGLWSLSYTATCATHDGPFSGTLTGDQLQLHLRPDEGYEATIDVTLRVVPGDSVLTGDATVVAHGTPDEPLCGSDELAPVTLHFGEVDGLPVGR
jgi:hypothetical protein